MKRKQDIQARKTPVRKAVRPMKVRLSDPATADTRAVRFGTGAISPSLRK